MVKGGGIMLKRDDVILNNSDTKILWAIFETLQEIKSMLRVPATAEQTQESKAETSLEGLKRQELMALIKALPERPEGWTRFTNQEMINLLKKEGA
jgi:hypothetical protein